MANSKWSMVNGQWTKKGKTLKKIVFIISALMLITTFGCESDETTNPVVSAEYQIVLENLPDSLTWLSGEELTIPVNALVLNKEGSLAPGIRVEFAVTSESGAFDTPGNVSDQHGRVSAVATLTPEEGWQEFLPLLIVPGGSAGGRVAVQGIRQPSRIAFVAPNTTFKVGQGGTVETSFKAIFSDEDGVGIAGLPVKVGLQGEITPEAVFGSVSAPPLTDGSGELVIGYNSAGGTGAIKIFIGVDLPGMAMPLDTSLTLSIRQITDDIGSLTVRAVPNRFIIPPDSLVTSVIRMQVLDVNAIGMPDIAINLQTDLGSFTRITATDASGIATAEWRNNFQGGTAHILASIPGTGYEATTTIGVLVLDVGGHLEISSDVIEIFADNGLTTANITASLKDDNNQALEGKTLIFSSTHGAIPSPHRTDEYGRVQTVFTDVGIPSLDQNGNVIPAKIYVKYDPLWLIDSCEVTITPRNPVSEIAFTTSKNHMVAASGDSASIKATAILANNRFASPGTLIHFEVAGNNGQFVPAAVPVGNFGVAETKYIAGNSVGTAVLRAFVENGYDSTIYSNEVEIELLPGPPHRVRVSANPTELFTNDPNAYSTIRAIVTDTAGNAVQAGTLVRFTTTMGDITPSAITNDNGSAYGRLTPGVSAGVAEITATVNLIGGIQVIGTATVTFTARGPNSIRITVDPAVIQAAETGGISNSTISALVVDPNGNPIGRSTTVVFKLPEEPEGRTGSTWSNGTRIDSTRSANGVATISLNAGLRNGPVFIQAYTWRDPDTVWADEEHTIPGLWRTDTVRVQGYFVRVEGGAQLDPVVEIELASTRARMEAGSGEVALVRAVAFTIIGRFANEGIPVNFQVVNQNGRFRDGMVRIEANGVAENFFIAGDEPGVALLRAWIFNEGLDTVFSNVVEIALDAAGMPGIFEIGFDVDGDDAGGGTWQIPVFARLTDDNGNPWRNNVPVGFYGLPDDAATVEAGFTGNDIGFGAQAGVAWSWLSYHSVKSWETITLQAQVQTVNGSVTEEIPLRLPLQDGTLELNADPSNWLFDRDRPDDTCLVRIYAMVQDGHAISGFDGIPVRFTTARGWFAVEEGRRVRDITVPTENGVATVHFRCKLSDLEDQLGYVDAVIVNAEIPGLGVDADPTFVFFGVR